MSEASSTTSAPSATPWGLLAQFDSPGALLRAARETCKAGYTCFDVYSPFPVHGMDQAMGLGRSKLGWIIAGGALAGFLTAVGLQYFVAWDYPLVHQGKPFYAWQPYTIVCFELTVLFASFAAVIGMFFLNGLPLWYHPTLKPTSFAKATDNGFFLTIESRDQKYSPTTTREFLEQLGAVKVETLEE